MGQVGERLRQAREAKGLTLAQMEELTRIRQSYLRALEEDNYSQLPGETFVRGFLHNYASALDLDPAEILAASGYKVATAEVPINPEPGLLNEPLTRSRLASNLAKGVLGVVVVAAVGFGGWQAYRYWQQNGQRAPSPTATLAVVSQTTLPTRDTSAPTLTSTNAPSATPSLTNTPAPTSTPTRTPVVTGITMHVEATQRAWVSIKVDDKEVYSGTLEVGEKKDYQGKSSVSIRCGNAGGVRVAINGQDQPPLGESGQVADRTWNAGAPGTSVNNVPAGSATTAPLGAPPNPTAAPTVTKPAAGGGTAPTNAPPPTAKPAAPTAAPTTAPTRAPTAAPTSGPTATKKP